MTPVSSDVEARTESVPHMAKVTEKNDRRTPRIFHAVAWTGSAMWAVQLVNWAYIVILARILSPSDYGLIGMASVPLGFSIVASECGIGNAVVMMLELTEDQISQLNTLAVVCGIFLFAISCLAAYPLGIFFRAPDLPMVVMVMSLALVITSFKIVPDGLLQRDLRFKLLAQIQATEAVIYGVVAITSALLGARYWSLAIANVASVTLSALLVLSIRRHAFAWPRIKDLRRSLVFSTHVLGLRVAWYWNCNADFAVVGRVLGKAALGTYSIAWNISQQPLQKLTDLVTRVVPAYFAKLHNDVAALRECVLMLTRTLALLTLPATLGLAVVADDFVTVVFGAKWNGAVLPLRMLALFAATRSITGFFVPLLNVVGQFRFAMWNHVLAALYFSVAFYFGSHWGVTGVALVWPLFYPCVALPLYLRVFKQIALPWARYWECVRPALQASTMMVGAGILIRAVMPPSTSAVWRLVTVTVSGAAIYGVTLWVLHREELFRLYYLFLHRNKQPERSEVHPDTTCPEAV